ncbi:multidrug resistance protein 1 [Kockovaella imperatae]|uniref:Multidrug resistance protein 1 n=1 Tax=Kockovaella imperatae TaxID=4999 RepID=A0A1Y1UT14_9TREE|nr:multidrug resistance protein 1 [Kockovaella imperatae]ORX41151.1 multidrug resistance protein 1 [Kockovaella imperatae]
MTVEPDSSSDRVMEDATMAEKQELTREGAVATSGVPMPTIQGPISVDATNPSTTKAAHTSISNLPSAAVSEKTLRASTPTSSEDTGVSHQQHGKKKGFSFGKSRKAKEAAEKKNSEKEEELAAIPPVGFFKLYRFATPLERTFNIIGVILAAAAGAAQPLMTLIFGRFTTSITEFGKIEQTIAEHRGMATAAERAALEAAKHDLRIASGHNALYLMAIGIGIFITTFSYMFIFNWTGELNAKRIRQRYLKAVLRQDIAYFDDVGAGEVATRIQTDCHLVQEGTSEKVALVVQYFATFVTGFVLAFVRGPILALALSSILIVIMFVGIMMHKFMGPWNMQALDAIAKGGSLAEEVVGSVRTAQAFGTVAVLRSKFEVYMDTMKEKGRKLAVVEGLGVGGMFFAIYSAYALAFFFGGILAVREPNKYNAGVVINVFMSILIGSFSMAMVQPEMQKVTKAQGAAAKLFSTIDRIPAIDSADPGGEKPNHVDGTITFENVKFHYPSRPNVPILKGLTINFPAGKTTALVGASGSGKSTVVSLIERFYDPISGTISLDGRELKSLNLKWLRQNVGLVSQEPTLFGTTVRGNVEHGLIGSKWENASDAEKLELVKKACMAANAHDFILKLPHGYDTHVGERGMLLSGGQKQRVAIARAIVSDPRILLLDEATSALDTQSEGIVQDALDKASKGRTTIVIAHRLSTVKDADTIVVMGGGEILEQGTHYDLLADENGPYAQLVANQKLAMEAAKAKAAEDGEEVADPDAVKPAMLAVSQPGSPVTEKNGYDLTRAVTGRSLASAMMEDITAKKLEEEEAAEKTPNMFKMYKRLTGMNGENKWFLVLGLMGAMASGMTYPALSILFGSALQDFQLQDPNLLKHELTVKARYYFITAILAASAITVQISCFARAGWDLTAKLRGTQFSSVLRHDIEWFDEEKNSTGAVTSDIADTPQRIQGLFGSTMGTILQSLTTLIGGCIIGLCYGPLLALIGIACIPILVSGGFFRLHVVVLKEQKTRKIHASSAHLASEAAGAVRTVASLTREDDVDRIYSTALKGPLKVAVQGSIKSQLLYGASQGISFCIIALVFYVGSLWIISGRYDTAHFFTVLTAVIFASIQAGNVFNFVPDASKANGAAANYFRLVDNVPEIDALSPEGIQLDPTQVQGHIRIEGVHFRYPSRPGVRVLRDLSLDVPPGTYVALVGASGCGKSTTTQMIERFYDPLIGKVTLDGVDIREINVASYRSQLALVSQEPTLYAGTVRFNICLGANKPMEEVTDEELFAAAKNANIYDFVMSLPDGFDTEVGGKGSQLSGGQKQRIAIARALIRNPKVLLLDEATSALDSQSERVVQDALDKAAKGRTTIAIAHRLSTIQKADIIYCFADGKVKEKGTHSELLALKGSYYELVQMQNLSRQQ